jgi:hypothetical protein
MGWLALDTGWLSAVALVLAAHGHVCVCVDAACALLHTQVFAGARFHPGVNLLHSAAQHMASKLQQAAAANGASARLAASSITALLESYGRLAYAPPKVLLQLLRAQLLPQMHEVEPPQLAGGG